MKLTHNMENMFYTFEQIDKSIHEDLIPKQKKSFEKPEFNENNVDCHEND